MQSFKRAVQSRLKPSLINVPKQQLIRKANCVSAHKVAEHEEDLVDAEALACNLKFGSNNG